MRALMGDGVPHLTFNILKLLSVARGSEPVLNGRAGQKIPLVFVG
jgi:hypothetical protein